MQTTKHKILLSFLIVSLGLTLIPLAQAQTTYIFNYENYGGYIRIPSFSVFRGTVTYENTTSNFEFNITLTRKPTVNTWSISIETLGWTWYYQPPLNQELNPSEWQFLNETLAINGSRTIQRPENVVGSYAIYSNQYKVLHLYRPLLIDANGNKVWGSLNVTGNTLTISASQTWLNSCVYPLTIDPTFGYESVGASEDSSNGDIMCFTKFTMPESGTVTKISAYLKSWSGTVNCLAAIYADSSGPAGLLDSSSAISVDNSFAWRDFTMNYANSGGSVALWIGWFIDVGMYYKYDAGSVGQFAWKDKTYPTLPNPWTDENLMDIKASIHADYTTGGASYSFNLNGTVALTSALTATKTMIKVNSQTVTVESTLSSQKAVTTTITETVNLVSALAITKSVAAHITEVLTGTVNINDTLTATKHLAVTLVEIAETVNLTSLLTTVLGTELTVEDALAFAVVAFLIAIGAFGLLFVYRKRRSQ